MTNVKSGERKSDELSRLFQNDALTPGEPSSRIRRSLRAIRSHLGFQVAYVSKFADDQVIFREVDAPGLEHLIKPGDHRALDEVYCRHILEGRLPELIPDTSAEPIAAAMPITAAASIGAHISAPIRLPDGEPYGMFCCIGFQPDKTLNQRDLQTLKAFAEIAAFEIHSERQTEIEIVEKRNRISRAIADNEMSMAFQPIWDVGSPTPVGFECLARFAAMPYRSPDQWFAEAAEIGMGVALELEAVRKALRAAAHFPPKTYIGFNASPAAILSPEFRALMAGVALGRMVIEVTEHSTVENYDELLATLRPLRKRGLRLAVDDAGAGYCSLRHILNMQPDFIKLDIGLTQNIDLDPARRALGRALVGFAEDTGSRIVAEGVERQSELDTLHAIGVGTVQGYLLGRPVNLGNALKLCDAKPRDGQIDVA